MSPILECVWMEGSREEERGEKKSEEFFLFKLQTL